ncbi:MAG: fibronectin type III domain-containing protein [Betaproteobacteria bacterium]|nr:fibronectin type III domain-containing protein [Betaproteobacteria bacterium]
MKGKGSAKRSIAAAVACAALFFPALAAGQAPAPPSGLTARDHSWDNGTRIDLQWTASADEATLRGYVVRRRSTVETNFSVVDIVPAGTNALTVGSLNREAGHLFRVTALGANSLESTPAATTAPVFPTMEWFDGTRVWFLFTLVLLCGSVVAFIVLARRGMPLTLRRIAGLEAVDDAVGRATEMGRPCLFIPGINDMNEIQTIAGLTILSRVAKTAAEYDAKLEVPTSKSLVMTAARETMQTAFLTAGRPEAYNPDSVYYVTDEQFGYVAYVQGLMVREKPAACFYMGSFFAESLILAETGNAIGAIQIAGTAQPAQLPFFVAACDYTLIGEEFFAASAYLSGEPDQLGSLKGQDVGKLLVGAGILLGVLGATAAALTGSAFIESLVNFFTGTMLT